MSTSPEQVVVQQGHAALSIVAQRTAPVLPLEPLRTDPLRKCDVVDVLGVRISITDVAGLRREIEDAVGRRTPLTITFANPNYVMAAHRDIRLRALMNSFDLNLPDGWGVVLAARILGKPIPDRMANDDLTDDLFGLPAERGWRLFLFGNAPGVADAAATNLRSWFPGLDIVGTRHGHCADPSGRIPRHVADEIIAEINAARPDVLHVGLGTPLQQLFVTENRDRLEVPVIVTCGAYFEHLAEGRTYYPDWVLRHRIGWLYRLYREPRKLWRRYSIELVSYLLRVLAYRFSLGRQEPLPPRRRQEDSRARRFSPRRAARSAGPHPDAVRLDERIT